MRFRCTDAKSQEPPSNVALQLTADIKELRLLASLAGAYDDGSAAAELWR